VHVLQNHTWLREYFHYHGISADLERRGFGSPRPELAWAIRQKQQEPEKPVDDQNKSVKSSSPNAADSTTHYRNFRLL
jgi:hypothetical protein